MSTDTFIIVAILTFGFLILIFLQRKSSQQKPSQELLEIMKLLQTSSQEDRKVLLDSLHNNTKALNDRLDNAAKVIAGVSREIGEVSEIGRSMKDLQDLLRSPKIRGNIGEQVLKELLGQMLPKSAFHLQYSFSNGTIVDAAIQTTAGIIPVDAKFPVENFQKMAKAQNETEKKLFQNDFYKDVKKHIDDISRKYINTDQGTIDYALMYIPSEAVYYEIICADQSLVDYAHEKRVLPVSPTTFYAYLRAILMSFEGQKIDQKAKEMLSIIRSIQKDYSRVEENINTLGKHITNSYNMMSQVTNGFSQLGQKITATNSLAHEVKEEVDESKQELLLHQDN